MSDSLTDSLVASLQAERVGYLRRGLIDRVAQVDEQLALLGVAVEPVKRGPGRPRKTPGIETAVDR